MKGEGSTLGFGVEKLLAWDMNVYALHIYVDYTRTRTSFILIYRPDKNVKQGLGRLISHIEALTLHTILHTLAQKLKHTYTHI